MSPRVRRPHLAALTGLRFFAGLYVVLYHYAIGFVSGGPRWLDDFTLAGPVAVSVFFVLSGLVLTYGSTDAEGRCAVPRREFWFARFSRIYPLFALAVIPALPANYAMLHHTHQAVSAAVLTVVQAVLALAMLQAWVPHLAFTANPPGWSLSVEAFFYALFPLLVHRLRCRTVRQLLLFTIPLWVLAMAPSMIVETIEHHGGLRSTSTTSVLGIALTPALVAERLAAQFPVARLAEFCIGICIGHFVVARTDARAVGVESLRPAAQRSRAALGVAGITAAGLLVVALVVAGHLHERAEILVNSAFTVPIVAVLLISQCLGRGPLVALLSSRMITRLGAASYALYIIQDPFAWWWQKLPTPALASAAGLGVFLVAIIAASLACERWIEIPARQWLLTRRAGATARGMARAGASA